MDKLNVRHILVPLDFYESSFNALETAVAMAKRQGAKLTVLHVIKENFLPADRLGLTAHLSEFEKADCGTRNIMWQIADNLVAKHGIEAKGRTSQGFVSSEICQCAQMHGADLIVMGSHGAARKGNSIIGSNAYAVVKHAACPVLTVPSFKKWRSFSKVLLPVSNTDQILEKCAYLHNITFRNKATLIILGIPDGIRVKGTHWLDDKVDQITSAMQNGQVKFQIQMLKPSAHTTLDVFETAAFMQADLIAISTSQDYEFRDFFYTPPHQQISSRINVPVLCIRPRNNMSNDNQKIVQPGWGNLTSYPTDYNLQYPRSSSF
jgi:nucleotide-binding universal stress UspA family protein